ncbi:MAG: DUF3048 domain-containing protein [Patescibacteria group bacterium]
MLQKRTIIITIIIAFGSCLVGFAGYYLSTYFFYNTLEQNISTITHELTPPLPEVSPGTHPLTGLPYPATTPIRKPFAVVIDNTPEARPQYGLSAADIVYETLTEGGVTRLLALFSSQQPLRIGPIRSARPYFIRQAQDWDAVFAHSGGSTHALEMLKTGVPRINNLDEFSNGNAFVRTSQTPPHNLFASYVALETLAENKALPLDLTALPSWAYTTNTPEGPTTTSFTIPYNLASMKVSYQYDESLQTYTRVLGGQPHRDAETNKPLSPANIILEFREMADIPDPQKLGLIDFAYAGAGDAMVFTKGKRINGRWTRSSDGPTVYATITGRTIALKPGQTFIDVLPATMREEILSTIQ